MASSSRSNLNSNSTNQIHNDNGFLDNENKPSVFGSRKSVSAPLKYDQIEQTDIQLVIKACMAGNITTIREYINSGNDVNKYLITGWTLLLYAASYAQLNIIEYLLSLGGDPNLHQEGYTPLLALSFSTKGSPDKRLKCLKCLINGKADVNATNKHKETPLMLACKMQEIDFILELLKYTTHINFSDSEQRTALFYAVANKRYDVTKILIENGADTTWMNYRGLTPYDIAITKGYDKLIPLLSRNYNQDEADKLETKFVSSWLDIFSIPNETDMDVVDSDIVGILYGMGLEGYKNCFRGIDLKTFLSLREEDMEKMGVDISVHRTKFIEELYRFHKHEWSNNLLNIDKSKPFDNFETIKVLGNMNKQLKVISSSIYFSKNYLDSIQQVDERDLTVEERQKIEDAMKEIEEVSSKIKEATNQIKNLAKVIDVENQLTLPTYIEKTKKKKSSNHKWILITVVTIAGIYFLRMKAVRRLWNSEKSSSKNWRNIFNFSFYDFLPNRFYDALFLSK